MLLRGAASDRLDKLRAHNDGSLDTEFKEIADLAKKERGEVPDAIDILPTCQCESDEGRHTEYAIALQSSCLKSDQLASISEESSQVVKDHQDKAQQLVASMVRLVDANDQRLDSDIVKELRLSHVGKLNFDEMNGGQTLVIMYDVKTSGEDGKRPSYRRPGFRKTHLERVLGLVLQSRTATPGEQLLNLRKRDVVAVFDAGKDGLAGPILACMKIGDKAYPTVPDC